MTEPSGRRGSGQFYRDTIKISNPSPSQAANNDCFLLIYRDDGAPLAMRGLMQAMNFTLVPAKKKRKNKHKPRKTGTLYISQ